MAFYCCLKGSYRPDPLSAAYCSSGYFNPQCTLTESCSFQVSGTSLTEASAVVAETGTSCGDAGYAAETWNGITNPQNATSYSDPTAVFDFGTASSGTVGDYILCHGSSINAADFPDHVGSFTMKGPSTGQSFSCTLGADCILTLAGFSQAASPASYKVVITAATSCGTGLTAASFSGTFENPRAVWDNDNDNYYEMKVGTEGDTTVTYKVCWSANPASLDEYILHVGDFTMNGPTTGMSHACTMGKTCTLTLQGSGFSQNNGVLVAVGASGVCPLLVDSLVSSFGSSFVHPTLPQASPYTVFSFGSPLSAHDNQPGSGYRVCWSSSPTQTPPSKVNADYSIDAGLFTLNGPVQTNHQCVLTQPCEITLTGSGLSTIGTHGLLLLEEGASCGQAADLVNASGASWTNPAAASGTSLDTFVFDTSTQGVPLSSYVICWAFGPTTPLDYNVYVGTFELGGPDLLYGSTCVKGESCVITLTGIAFASTNKILVVDTGSECGSSAVPATFSPMEVEKLVQDGTFTEYQLGRPNTGTAQSGYTICWSASPSSTADFPLTLGDFTVTGPNVQNVACTLGLSCIVELIGLQMESTNKMIVLSAGECGDNGPTLSSVTGMLNSITVTGQSPYNSYDLNTPLAGQPSTDYKLCWSSAPADGAGAAFYRVPVGLLTLNGPVQVSQACTMSLACQITLTGVGLAASNQLLLIHSESSCGDVSATTATFDGLTNPVSPTTGNVAVYDLGIARTTSDGPGSGYTVCWGHNGGVDYWNIQLGTFSISGPDAQTTEVTCTMGLSCSIQATGVNLASTNKIAITALSDICGQTSLNMAIFPGAANPVSASGSFDVFEVGIPTGGMPGDYKVCWGYSPSADTDYHVPVLTLRMGGPVARSSECTLSEPCKIDVEGVRLAHTSKLLFISTSSSCGDSSPTIVPWSGFNNPASTDLLMAPANPGYVYANGDRYDGGIGFAGTPGSYQVCWGFDPTSYDHYNVPLGSFIMNGPFQGLNVACTLGTSCVIEPTGVGLNDTNQLQLVAGSELCGSADIQVATIQGLSNPVLVADSKFTLGAAVVGGSYTACKVPSPADSCIGSHYRLCWAHGVYDGGANFVVELGVFSMSGPYGTYRVDCTMGSICSFTLYGSNLALTNRVLIVEELSSCGDASPVIVSFAGLMNPGVFSQLATDSSFATVRLGKSHAGRPGSFRLCWGFSPLVLSDYVVDVGMFYFHDVPEGCTPGAFGPTCSVPR
ncbi:unnamed protein product [Durusdinium trenchii]|uniref:Uncharacterized protein n=1 Tax=Durusdinium trenchii TaxID=1381693 RepID=A0ABP0NDS1_9DINO